MTRFLSLRRAALAVAALTILGASPALADPPVPVQGAISAGGDHLEPIAQDGNLVTFLHVDVHEFSGDMEGSIHIVELLTIDITTGDGTLTGEGTFVGTVLGSNPGTLRMKYHGDLKSFAFVENGRLVMSKGQDGLAGVHVLVSWDFIAGLGGNYCGLAVFDDRP